MATIQRILIPTDFSRSTRQILAHARQMAGRSPVELHLLHIVPTPGLPWARGEAPERRLRAAWLRLERLAQPLRDDGLTVVCEARSGRPAGEIVAYAREKGIDQISMSTHGRTGLAHVVLGSVTEQVVRHAPCPVLVTRPPAPELAEDPASQAEAAQALAAHFGTALVGPREPTWEEMASVLARDLGLKPSEARRCLEDLESARALRWQEHPAPGAGPSEPHWTIDAHAVGGATAAEFPFGRTARLAAGGPSIALDLLERALETRATDVHVDPKADDLYEVRFRIDGRVEHYCDLDRGIAMPLLQQLKVLANLDITEPFEPKEGRLRLPATLPDLDIRITTAPVQGGTAIALRLLRRDRALMPLEGLGLAADSLDAVSRMLHAGAGLVLVTGPTGAGKSTTIYSLLHQLSGRGRNIVSIEDPVELALPFMRQLAVNPKHHLTMTQGLRTILRMDPDIVFVSEIRDLEAAEIAMRAANSGRFVFTTLHTRDVASTVTALRDLHIDNRSLAGNLTGLLSQRLVRRLCPACTEKRPLTDAERSAFLAEEVEPPGELGRPVGCMQCRGTGYRDRIGIFEVVLTHGPAETAIEAGAPEDELRALLRSSGTPSLLVDALMKVRDGVTSLEEAQGMKWV